MKNKGRRHKAGMDENLSGIGNCKSNICHLTRPITSMSSKGFAFGKFDKSKWIKRIRGYFKSQTKKYNMAIEIERKFLVDKAHLQQIIKDSVKVEMIKQGYFRQDFGARVRIVNNEKAYLTIKLPVSMIENKEFEYEIPIFDGIVLLDSCDGQIHKLRYHYMGQSHLWEVDVFLNKHIDGLIVAEVELRHVKEECIVPDWIGFEVTEDPRYKNINLAFPVKKDVDSIGN